MTVSRGVAAVAIVLLVALGTDAAPAEDLVQQIPGYMGTPPVTTYSGYLDLPNGHHYHYMAFMAEKDPASAPVIQFMNGGPGASSLMFAFTEGGPYATNVKSLGANVTGAPELFLNPFAWTKVGTVLVIESPASVGLSYMDAPFTFNDTSTAEDNYAALKMFFDVKFPELKSNAFYLTGESYAGVYGIMLAQLIDQEPNSINFKGIALGDGCIGLEVGTCSPQGMRIQAKTLDAFHMISPSLFSEMEDVCTDWGKPNSKCSSLFGEMSKQAGDVFNVYYVYDTCATMLMEGASLASKYDVLPGGAFLDKMWNDDAWNKAALDSGSWEWRPYLDVYGTWDAKQAAKDGLLGQPDAYECGGETALAAWLSNKEVLKAIHAREDVTHYPFKYVRTAKDLRPLYAQLAAKYPILIYSGSADDCVPTIGSWEWTAGLGFEITNDWHPWYYQNQYGTTLGGYSTVYDVNGFTFATVQGAGHEVPEYSSEAGLNMIRSFISGTPL